MINVDQEIGKLGKLSRPIFSKEKINETSRSIMKCHDQSLSQRGVIIAKEEWISEWGWGKVT